MLYRFTSNINNLVQVPNSNKTIILIESTPTILTLNVSSMMLFLLSNFRMDQLYSTHIDYKANIFLSTFYIDEFFV